MPAPPFERNVDSMNLSRGLTSRLALFFGALLVLRAPRLLAQPSPAAIAAFDSYTQHVESRLAQQHRAADFLLLPRDAASRARLRRGELLIEHLGAATPPAGALLHHWRATAFVPGATPAQFEDLLRNFNAYPHNFAPQITAATVLTATPGHALVRLRTRQRHVLTVVLDTTCDVSFAEPDTAHGYSISHCDHVEQISPSGDDGFLYRLNTYWSYEQRDGGLYLQLESVSLTRSVPHGLAWAVQPYLDSIPRESLLFTLNSARNALHGDGVKAAAR